MVSTAEYLTQRVQSILNKQYVKNKQKLTRWHEMCSHHWGDTAKRPALVTSVVRDNVDNRLLHWLRDGSSMNLQFTAVLGSLRARGGALSVKQHG